MPTLISPQETRLHSMNGDRKTPNWVSSRTSSGERGNHLHVYSPAEISRDRNSSAESRRKSYSKTKLREVSRHYSSKHSNRSRSPKGPRYSADSASFYSNDFHSDEGSRYEAKQSRVKATAVASRAKGAKRMQNSKVKGSYGSHKQKSPQKETTMAMAKADHITRRVLSARQRKIEELKNNQTETERQIEELRMENRTLRKLQFLSDKAHTQREELETDLPSLLRRHGEEVRSCKEQLRKLKEKHDNAQEKLKMTQSDLDRVRKENVDLRDLAQNKNLLEREELSRRLSEAEYQRDTYNSKLQNLERHLNHLKNNHKHDIEMEMLRHKETRERILEMKVEKDTLADLLAERSRQLEAKNIYSRRLGQNSSSSTPLPSLARNRNFSNDPQPDPGPTPREKARLMEEKRREEAKKKRDAKEKQALEEKRKRDEEIRKENEEKRETKKEKQNDIEDKVKEITKNEEAKKIEAEVVEDEWTRWEREEKEKSQKKAEERRLKEQQDQKEKEMQRKKDIEEKQRREEQKRQQDLEKHLEMKRIEKLEEEERRRKLKEEEEIESKRLENEERMRVLQEEEQRERVRSLELARIQGLKSVQDNSQKTKQNKEIANRKKEWNEDDCTFKETVERMHHGQPAYDEVYVPSLEKRKNNHRLSLFNNENNVDGYTPSFGGDPQSKQTTTNLSFLDDERISSNTASSKKSNLLDDLFGNTKTPDKPKAAPVNDIFDTPLNEKKREKRTTKLPWEDEIPSQDDNKTIFKSPLRSTGGVQHSNLDFLKSGDSDSNYKPSKPVIRNTTVQKKNISSFPTDDDLEQFVL